MVLALLAGLGGLLLGSARSRGLTRGRAGARARATSAAPGVRPRRGTGGLLTAAVLVEVAAGVTGRGLRVATAAAAAAVIATCWRHRRLRGTGLVALGMACNAAVVLANGAMPVSLGAAARASAGAAAAAGPAHRPLTGSTRLAALGDWVPLPLPVLPGVVSPGDVLVAAGLAELGWTLAGASGGRAGSQGMGPPPASSLGPDARGAAGLADRP